MGGEQAANVLATVQRDNIEASGKKWSAEEEARFKAPLLEKYEKESHAFYSSARYCYVPSKLLLNCICCIDV